MKYAIVAIILLTGPEPRPDGRPGPEPSPAVITNCINSNCRCTVTYAGCIDCIHDNCDADWDDDETGLYRWWCRNKNRKGC